MTICEATLSLLGTKLITHSNYCNLMRLSINDGKLSNSELADIAYIMKYVDKIFSMGDDMTIKYIKDFFEQERYIKFEKPVRYMLEFYPISTAL